MKLECEILSVKQSGNELEVQLQGGPPNAPEWRGWVLQALNVPFTRTAAKALYAGRKVMITVTPK